MINVCVLDEYNWYLSLISLHSDNMNSSDLYDEFWVGVGEALKLILVQVHNEELVCGGQFHHHLSELLIKVANITARFLRQRKRKRRKGS